jgi:hypothetical protein
MSVNLDSLKAEIEAYLQQEGFLIFHGYARRGNEYGIAEIEWDTARYPDYKKFLEVAKGLGVKLIVLHYREFSAGTIEDAIDSLEDSGLEYQDQRTLETRLRELGVYEGFTCAIELSFDYEDAPYLFELRTAWYDELNDILDRLSLSPTEEEEDEGDPLGGYYSKN